MGLINLARFAGWDPGAEKASRRELEKQKQLSAFNTDQDIRQKQAFQEMGDKRLWKGFFEEGLSQGQEPADAEQYAEQNTRSAITTPVSSSIATNKANTLGQKNIAEGESGFAPFAKSAGVNRGLLGEEQHTVGMTGAKADAMRNRNRQVFERNRDAGRESDAWNAEMLNTVGRNEFETDARALTKDEALSNLAKSAFATGQNLDFDTAVNAGRDAGKTIGLNNAKQRSAILGEGVNQAGAEAMLTSPDYFPSKIAGETAHSKMQVDQAKKLEYLNSIQQSHPTLYNWHLLSPLEQMMAPPELREQVFKDMAGLAGKAQPGAAATGIGVTPSPASAITPKKIYNIPK